MENTPNITQKTVQHGIDLIRNKKTKEGMAWLKRIALEFPNCDWADDAWYYMGIVYQNHDRLQQAYTCYNKVVTQYPSSNVFKYASLRLQELQEQKDPGQELFHKGEHLFQQKSYEKAIATFEQLIAQFPKSRLADDAMLYKGMIYQNIGDLEHDETQTAKAKELFDRILNEYPDSDSAEFLRQSSQWK